METVPNTLLSCTLDEQRSEAFQSSDTKPNPNNSNHALIPDSSPSAPNSGHSTISSESSLISYSLVQNGNGAAIAEDGRYHNPVVMSFIRDDWIQQQLLQREHLYTQYQDIQIALGTWNVNAKKPLPPSDAQKIIRWVQGKTDINTQDCPDLVVIGLQEIVDLNAVNVVVNNHTTQRSAAWEECILYALNNQLVPNARYRRLAEKHLVGISLLVFVRKDHELHVKELAGATAGVGIMGMMGNKGGAAIRLKFYNSTLCFVSSHLAAHRDNVAARNADYYNILNKIDFTKDSDTLIVKRTDDFSVYTRESPILNHDFVFWFGDLNYRIRDDMSTEECLQLAESNQFVEKLVPRDQLLLERQRGNVFHGFEEAAIAFPPTYKFQPGTNSYDKRPEKKIRAPAYCDRILWKAKNVSNVENLRYTSIMEMDASDHKPVHATFRVKIKHQVEAKKQALMREILHQLDKWENENMPKVALLHYVETENDTLSSKSPNRPQLVPCSGVFHFPNVLYQVSQQKVVVLENIGVVVAHFRFIPKLKDSRICKNWISLMPSYGMIPPKEKIEICIHTMVDMHVAQKLAESSQSLEDTMILRIENGRDFFFVISGQYQISCFGCSIEQLVQCVEPIRFAPASALYTKAFEYSHKQRQQIPKELWRMIDDLYTKYLMETNLFIETGDRQEIALLREALDTGRPFPPHHAHSMAELLLTFLQALNGNVVQEECLLKALALGHGNIAQSCRYLLEVLSPVRYNVVIYLIAFLKEVLDHRQWNKLTPEKLAYVFSRCFVAQSSFRARDPSMLPLKSDASSAASSGSAIGGNVLVDLQEAHGARSSTAVRLTHSSSSATSHTLSSSSSTPFHEDQDPLKMMLAGEPAPCLSSMFPLEETLRRNARELEVEQENASARAEKMAKFLIVFLTSM